MCVPLFNSDMTREKIKIAEVRDYVTVQRL